MHQFKKEVVDFEDYYELLIPGIRLWISLGCSRAERANLQPVDVEIRIHLSQEPKGCRSDQLSDVYCYKQISEHIIQFIKDRSYNLIERLAADVFDVISQQMTENCMIEVVVSKPNHPIPYIQKPIQFKYCRRLLQKSL